MYGHGGEGEFTDVLTVYTQHLSCSMMTTTGVIATTVMATGGAAATAIVNTQKNS